MQDNIFTWVFQARLKTNNKVAIVKKKSKLKKKKFKPKEKKT